MSTSEGSGSEAGQSPVDDGQRYEVKVVKAVRGAEAKTEAKWHNEGWELVSQDKGRLRTEMTFRRPRPRTFIARVTEGYSAFRGLQPKTQKVALVGAGGLVLVVAIGIGVATSGGDDVGLVQDDPTPSVATDAQPTQPSAVEPSEEPDEPSAAETASEAGQAPDPEESQESEMASEAEKAAPNRYSGPEYETLWVDEDVVRGEADQYWVLVEGLDSDAEGFRDQIKSIISDVALEQGSDVLSVSVVTDEEIAAYESDLVGPQFGNEHDQQYINEVVRPKMESGYLAWYMGGFDHNTGELTDDDSAFEILWFPAGKDEQETWRPSIPTL